MKIRELNSNRFMLVENDNIIQVILPYLLSLKSQGIESVPMDKVLEILDEKSVHLDFNELQTMLQGHPLIKAINQNEIILDTGENTNSPTSDDNIQKGIDTKAQVSSMAKDSIKNRMD